MATSRCSGRRARVTVSPWPRSRRGRRIASRACAARRSRIWTCRSSFRAADEQGLYVGDNGGRLVNEPVFRNTDGRVPRELQLEVAVGIADLGGGRAVDRAAVDLYCDVVVEEEVDLERGLLDPDVH